MENHQELKSICRFFIVVSMIFIFSASITAQTRKIGNWAGAYTFFDAPGNSSSSTARRNDSYSLTPGVEYNIAVTKKGDGFSATLEINGMQQFEIYECSAKADGVDRLNFYFLSAGAPDSGQNNTQRFKKGSLLFSLMKIQIGSKTKYQFQSIDYKLTGFSPRAKKQSIYFQKTN